MLDMKSSVQHFVEKFLPIMFAALLLVGIGGPANASPGNGVHSEIGVQVSACNPLYKTEYNKIRIACNRPVTLHWKCNPTGSGSKAIKARTDYIVPTKCLLGIKSYSVTLR